MSTAVRITHIEVETLPHIRFTIRVYLENTGKEPLEPGNLIGKQVSRDGSVKVLNFVCPIGLAPGEEIWLRQQIPGSIKEMSFTEYDPAGGATGIPVRGLTTWWSSPWSLAA